ncbi:DUF3710 domain-containing protein [Gordonia sp. NPDC003429]
MAREDESVLRIGQAAGPYDIAALDTPAEDLENSHLDLGSVLVPVVEGGQVTVEMSADHQPEAVYLVTPHGRISVTAFAAPKSPGLWREVVRELVESLRNDGATTSVEDGHWGREIVAEVPGGVHRFIGVDGPRWMVRCVASGPTESATELAQLARAVLAESVIRRGAEPVPPREMLPIVLPPVLAEQVAAAQQQMFAQMAAQGAQVPPGFVPPPDADQIDADPSGADAYASDTSASDSSASDTSTSDTSTSDASASDPWASDPSGGDAESFDTPDNRIPGGALDQLEQAVVVTDDQSRVPVTDDVPATDPAEEPGAADDDLQPRSSGSAMQRFRRRRR